MDETSPVFENFRNKMQAFGQPIRGTTRRVSASKFLGRDDLEKRISINEKKITLLKNIIQAQGIQTGVMIASLSETSGTKVSSEILDIKSTLKSIVSTLEAQTKFENEKFLDMQRRLENQTPRGRESRLEGLSKRGMKLLNKGVQKILSPVTGVFSSILSAFTNLIGGKLLMGLADFLLNPAVRGIIGGLLRFLDNFFPLITSGFGLAVGGIALLLNTMGLLGPTLLFVSGFLLRSLGGAALASLSGPTETARLGVTRETPLMKKFKFFSGKGNAAKFFKRVKFNKGGIVPGTGNTDSVPAMLTPGEVVISKPAVEKFGAINLLNLNRSVGSSSKPKIKRGITYANEGAMVMPDVGGLLNAMMGSMQSLETSDLGKTLQDPTIPQSLQQFAESMAMPKDQQRSVASGISNTVFDSLMKNVTSSGVPDNFQKSINTLNNPSSVSNLLEPIRKLSSGQTPSGASIKSLLDDVIGKVSPQSNTNITNDTFNITLTQPNERKLETLGLIP